MSRSSPPLRILALGLGLGVVAAVAPTTPARAGELVPAIASQAGWDSNNDGVTIGEKGDLRARTEPELSIREEIGRFALNARARVAYENALDFGGLDDFWDQFGDVGVEWAATSRTQLSLTNSFARVQSIDRAIAVDSFEASEIPDNQGRRSRVIRNTSRFQLNHRITSRWSALASSEYTLRDFRSPSRFDETSLSGTGSLSYQWNARTTLGFGGRVTYDSFEGTSLRRGVRTRYYQGFLSLGYLIAPDLRMEMSAGPAWVEQRTKPGSLDFRSLPFVTSFTEGNITFTPQDYGVDPTQPFGFLLDQSTCPAPNGLVFAEGCQVVGQANPMNVIPVLITNANIPVVALSQRPGGESTNSNDIDVFASFSLVKSWEWGDVILAYNRRESSSGGEGTGATADSLTLSTSGYRPTPLWTISGLFSWTNRESSGDNARDLATLSPTNLEVDPATGMIVMPGSGTVLNGVAIADGFVTADSISNADEFSSFFVSLRADRRVSTNLSIYGDWSWRRDDRTGDLRSDTELDIFRIFIGARYTFDPISF